MRTLRNLVKDFINDRRGIFWEITIGITTIMIVDITYFLSLLVLNAFKTNFLPLSHNEAMLSYFGMLTSNAAIVTVAVLNIGIIIWMAVSAHKRETQDYPAYM